MSRDISRDLPSLNELSWETTSHVVGFITVEASLGPKIHNLRINQRRFIELCQTTISLQKLATQLRSVIVGNSELFKNG